MVRKYHKVYNNLIPGEIHSVSRTTEGRDLNRFIIEHSDGKKKEFILTQEEELSFYMFFTANEMQPTRDKWIHEKLDKILNART